MSRIGKMPIPLPKGVEVQISGNNIRVKGSKGELTRIISPDLSVSLDNGALHVARSSEEKTIKALHGLTRSLLANMVVGVSQGYQRDLEIVGVGFKAVAAGGKITLQLGYSHPIDIVPLAGVSVTMKDAQHLVVQGIDKELVGNVAAKIRKFHPPDHYKGKGVRYSNERVKLKPGKAGKAGAKK
jgi:large subunit ribosomal protein L6